MKSFHLLALLPVSLALTPCRGLATPKEVQVNVNVDLTDEGRKITLPTRDHPAYYFPVVGGFRQEGAVTAGDQPPSRTDMIKQLAVTLANNGYLVAGPKTPVPTVLLVFHWGSMNPQIDDFGDADNSNMVFFNAKRMLALVGGQTLNNLDLDMEREPVMQGAEEDRYFVMVAAYDFAAAQEHKKVLLWRTKMSTTANAVDFTDVMKALITSGGPLLGRETLRPVWVQQPITPKTSVKVHDFKVQEYLDPAPATNQKKP